MQSNSEKKGQNQWTNGVVLSFDFDTAKLKRYFSATSPQGAYSVIKNFLKKNGFEHRKDSDYVNGNIDKVTTVDILVEFADKNKWFPICVNKMNISPNVATLDITEELEQLVDTEWKAEKDKERSVASKQHSLSDYKKMIEEAKREKTMNPPKDTRDIPKKKDKVR